MKSVGKRKNSEKNLRHLRNLRDPKKQSAREKENPRENKKASEIFRNLRLLIKEGGYLLSRIAVPSAQVSLTSLFGMGRGGTSPQ